MSNNITLGYTGEVKIHYKKNGKSFVLKKKNEGFEPLFRTIASLLAGKGFPFGNPYYISLYNETSGKVSLLTSGRIPFSSLPDVIKQEDGRWSCTFNITIAYSDINTENMGENDTTYCMYLLSSNDTEFARVEVDKDTISSIGIGVQLYIEWSLIIDNAAPPAVTPST